MSVQLERLLRIYNRLRRGPVTIEIISKWAVSAGITVSDRQLYRDLNKLKSLQISEGENVVEYLDEKNRKTWKLEYQEESEKFTQFDINSFFLLKSFAPYAILEQRRPAIEKFERIIYKNSSRNKYQQLVEAGELYFRRTNYFVQMYGAIEHQQIEDMVWALHNKRAIVIESININPANIHFEDDRLPLKMYPLELVFHLGRAYISGVSPENDKVLTFAVDENFGYSLTNERFNRKKVYDSYSEKVKDIFGISDPKLKKVYNIKVEFTSNYGESWKNYFWHDSQRWELQPNGNYMLHLRCTLGRELFGFLAYGLDKIKVHQPKVLKDLLVKKFQGSVDIHKKDLPIDEAEANREY